MTRAARADSAEGCVEGFQPSVSMASDLPCRQRGRACGGISDRLAGARGEVRLRAYLPEFFGQASLDGIDERHHHRQGG